MDMKCINFMILCVIGLSAVCYWKGYGLRYNTSESLPYTFYVSMPATTPEKWQTMDFRLNKSHATFVKIVAGIPGDRIENKNHKIYVDDSEIGNLLEGYEPIAEGIIPEGFYFMWGTHPHSFDSRYAEFGLVPKNAIKERLCPIF